MASKVQTAPQSSARESVKFGLSGKEIIALEDEIKQLKMKVVQRDKALQGLETVKKELESQVSHLQIEVFSAVQQRDEFRLKIDELN